MGVGRREFLRLFGAALGSLALRASPAVALLDDLYLNRKLGLAFKKPSRWHFGDVREMGKIKGGQLLDLDDAELAREIIEATDFPIVCISQTTLDASSGDFTPGVTFFLQTEPDPDIVSEVETNPVSAGAFDAHSCGIILKDFKVLSPPKRKHVS